MRSVAVATVLAAPALVAAAKLEGKTSPIAKVISMLGDLKTKVQSDLAAEDKAMDEYSSYCDDESKEKGFAIKTAASEIEDFSAAIEGASCKISEYASTLDTAGTEVSDKTGELAEARKVIEEKHKVYLENEKELTDCIDTLGRAASVLERELSFVQQEGKPATNAAMQKKLGGMVMALSAIVDAEWVSTAQKQKLESFLKPKAQEDDLSLVQQQQPQASTKAYESKSGGIVETLKDMQDKAEDQLNELHKYGLKTRGEFNVLEQTLTDAIANLNEQISEASSSKCAAEEAKAKAEQDMAKTKECKSADEECLKNLTTECQSKAAEWEERQKSAEGEMAALDKAKEILAGGVKLFVQVGAKTQKTSAKALAVNEQAEEVRSDLVRKLKKMSRKYNSFALVQLANQAKADPFVKIRGLVEEMISKLEKQAADEATQDSWCKAETKKTRAAEKAKNADVDKHQTRIDKCNAFIEVSAQEIAALKAELNEIAECNSKSTAIRTEEKAENEKASKDYKDSADAVAMAMEALKEFYAGSAFIQTAAGEAQPSFAAKNKDSANAIFQFLEVSQEDFTRLHAETVAEEEECATAYEKLMQDNAVSKAAKDAECKGKESEVAFMKKSLEEHSSDLETSEKELSAVMEYMDKLKPQCESKAMTYEERKAKRDAEIAGLKQALDILAGDVPAVFFQKMAAKKFLAKQLKL